MTWRENFKTHAPNEIQYVPIELIEPSSMNVRLFIERESLDALETVYRAWDNGTNKDVVLPDPPVINFKGWDNLFELLAGHRRLTAAHNARITLLPVRCVTLGQEDAYKFIRQANNYETLTTIERSYAVAEMDRLGFTIDEVRETMGTIGVSRYLAVGRMVNPDWFSDIEKRCDPTITVWGYAAKHGPEHFAYCFKQWDAGLWDEEDCNKEFRRAGHSRPPEPYQAGAIISVDETGTILRFRGTLDLSIMTAEEIIDEVVTPLIRELLLTTHTAKVFGSFGPKRKGQFSPEEL
jgi:hypothetical protein